MADKKYARVVDNVVVETVFLPSTWDLNNIYHHSIATQFVACPAGVKRDWTYVGGKFYEPVAPAITKDNLIDYAHNTRSSYEAAGVMWGEFLVPTTKEDCDRVTSIKGWQDMTGEAVDFSFGSFSITLTPEMVKALAIVQGSHVQKCFSVYAAAVKGVGDGSITTYEAIDNLDWPDSE